MNNSIDQLRQTIRRRRRQLGIGAQHQAAQELAKLVCSLECYQHSQNIALYLANDGELDCRFLLKQAWRDGKHCYLPVVKKGDAASRLMSFVRYLPGEELVSNRYGILEPKPKAAVSPQMLDLVLVPLVAFDQQGHRIGMGGGYYDRAFAFKKGRSLGVRSSFEQNIFPLLMGVAHRLQEVHRVVPQAWDVPLDRVVKI